MAKFIQISSSRVINLDAVSSITIPVDGGSGLRSVVYMVKGDSHAVEEEFESALNEALKS
jgi:hypothetical protein